MIKKLFLLFSIIIAANSTFANGKFIEKLSDKAQISLLTCGAGEEIYARFGHTAIRVMDTVQGIDFAFNYGMFDSGIENFEYKFAAGLTDYWADYEFTGAFFYRYCRNGIAVWEQTLNLTQDEKQNLFNALIVNCLPENREYRYNFVYDNCATRPRDMIEYTLRSDIIYPDLPADDTFRELVAGCLGKNSWNKFGTDLLLGAPADVVATPRERMFLPLELKKYLQEAHSTEGRAIVSGESTPVNLPPLPPDNPFFSPFLIFSIFALFIALASFFARNRNTVCIDGILFFVSGLLGLLLFFLSNFSLHPLVEDNYNLLWLNPLQLIFALLLPIKKLRNILAYYQILNALLITMAIAGYLFLPQTFNLAFLPLMFALLCRAVLFVRNQQIFSK